MVARGEALRTPGSEVLPIFRSPGGAIEPLAPLRGSIVFFSPPVPGVALRSTPGYHRSPLRGYKRAEHRPTSLRYTSPRHQMSAGIRPSGLSAGRESVTAIDSR